jgi:hypothetical protein
MLFNIFGFTELQYGFTELHKKIIVNGFTELHKFF